MHKNSDTQPPKSGPSYTAWMSITFIMILAFAFLAVCGYKLFESNENYHHLSELNASVKSSLVDLATQVDSLTAFINSKSDQPEGPTAGVIPVFAAQAIAAVQTINDKITAQASPLAESLSIMQGQYDQFTGYLNFLFIVLAAVLTIFTIAIPFMNYNFLQKDQIFRLNRQYSELEDKMSNELTRMQNAIAQATQVSSEIAVSDISDANEIKPISNAPADVAQAAYISSQISFGRGNYQDALSKLDTAVNLLPENVDYRFARGATLHQMKRYEEALKDKEAAVRKEPNNARYLNSRSITLRHMKRYEEALQDVNEAVRLEPNNARYLDSRSITLHEMERYEEALKDLDEAVRLEPNNARYRDSRGTTLHEMKRYKEALKDFDEAVRLDPNNAWYRDGRRIILHRLKRYNEALTEANRASDLEPDIARYIAGVGVELYSLHQYDIAMEKFDAALQKDNPVSFIYRYRGLCTIRLIEQGYSSISKVDALRDLDKAIEMENDFLMNYLARAEYYIWQNEYDMALTDLNKALSLDECEPEVYHMFALYNHALGDLIKADIYHKLAIGHGYITEP